MKPSSQQENTPKQQKRPTMTIRRSNHNTGRYMLAPFVIFIFASLVVLFASPMGNDTVMFPVIGGIVGMLSSSYVMIAYLIGSAKNRGPPLALLFWRSFCDFGLSTRFVASHAFQLLVCGHEHCKIHSGHDNQEMCGVPSAMFEFFEMASEAWFLCIAFDLLVSISNPFSSFKSRMKYYHTFVWTTASAFALPVGVDHKIGGYWYIQGDSGIVDKNVFCWLKMQNTTHGQSWVPWIFFYLPLMTIYIFSASVLYFAYGRLKKGISNTFVHRLRVLVINSINLTSCFLYWLILVIVFAAVYGSVNTDLEASQILLKLLQYLIPAKGISGVIVWVLVMSIDIEGIGGQGGEAVDEESLIDLNSALRQEVLLYSQGGIKVCALHMKELADEYRNKDKLTWYLNHGIKALPHEDTFTPWFFLRLIFGFQEQIDKVSDLMVNKDHKMTEELQKKRHSLSDIPTYSQMFSGDSPNSDGTSSRVQSLRLSQRATIATNGAKKRLTPGMESDSNRTSGAILSMQQESSERDSDSDYRPFEGNSSRPVSGVQGAISSIMTRSPHSPQSRNNNDHTCDIEMADMNVHAAERGSLQEDGLAGAWQDFVLLKDETAEEANTYATWGDFGPLVKLISRLVDSLLAMAGLGRGALRENDKVSFTEFRPFLFRQIRLAAGLSDDKYVQQFKKTIKERLTQGGSSGAFFFFSKDESLIAKSCTEEELDNITGSAVQYSQYICDHPKSFISRIYGVYRLRIYGTSMHFFVMNNIFLNDRGHSPDRLEKYDLKGSWVARNAAHPRPGDKVTCKLCQQRFVYKKKKRKLRGLLSPLPTPARSRDISNYALQENGNNPSKQLQNDENGADGGTVSPLFASTLTAKLTSLVSPSRRQSSRNDDIAHGPNLNEMNCSVGDDGNRDIEGSASYPNADCTAPDADQQRDVPILSRDIPLSPEDCPVSPLRVHEASVILKDNDLKSKLYLPSDVARDVLEQLKMDAGFLKGIRVMDYSLLMGVHYTSYMVDVDDQAPSDHIPPPHAQEKLNTAPPHSLPSFNTPPSSVGTELNRKRASTLSKRPPILASTYSTSPSKRPADDSNNDQTGTQSNTPQHGFSYATAYSTEPEPIGKYATPYEVSRVVGPDCYYMGIIDFQQQWTWAKRIERHVKILFKGAEADGLSAMPPEQYMKRFIDHMEDLLELDGENQRPYDRSLADRSLADRTL